ncbi:MAG: hypothetical protein HC888_07010 [Candidatus Competibacteraceae bacterium]|nr:hypothetical protein [Candidatus Competibacteraceae bacterium]
MNLTLINAILVLGTAAAQLNNAIGKRIAEEFQLASGTTGFEVLVYPEGKSILGLVDDIGEQSRFSGEYSWNANNQEWFVSISNNKGSSVQYFCGLKNCCTDKWSTDAGNVRSLNHWEDVSSSKLQAIWPYLVVSRHLFPITTAQKHGVAFWSEAFDYCQVRDTQKELAVGQVKVCFVPGQNTNVFMEAQDGSLVPFPAEESSVEIEDIDCSSDPLMEEIVFNDGKMVAWHRRSPELLLDPNQPIHIGQLSATLREWSGYTTIFGSQVPEFCTVSRYFPELKEYRKLWTSRIVIESITVPLSHDLNVSICCTNSGMNASPFDWREELPWHQRLWNSAKRLWSN